MSADDDLESLHETLFWLQQPEIRKDLADGEQEHAAGTASSGEQVRARYGLPALWHTMTTGFTLGPGGS